MIKKYTFFSSNINEANIKNRVKREDLKVGDYVMTCGEFDGVNLEYQIGRILSIKEYGNILIEFDKAFSKQFHAGFKDVGKKGHCFYIPLDNISTNNREEFEKIIKKVGQEKQNKAIRLNAKYKEGDIIVGIGKLSYYGRNVISIDGEIGIIYYSMGKGAINQEDRNEKNNEIYWVGFLDRFDKNMNVDEEGLPKNRAGMNVDKIHMRPITDEEKEKIEKKLGKLDDQIKELKQIFKIGDVVIANGNYSGLVMKNEMGVIIDIQDGGGGRRRKQYGIQFFENFSQYLYDINYLIGSPMGYYITKGFLRESTAEETEKQKLVIKTVQENIKEFNYNYKINEYVITRGGNQYGMNLDGQIGIIRAIRGTKPKDQFDVEFIVNFDSNLRKIGKYNNSYTIMRGNLSRPKEGDNIEELLKKVENNELTPFKCSPTLSMLLARINFKLKTPFMTQSYFDTTDKNDVVSYLPLDKFKRLEKGENPYKSRLRQQIKVGKFFRMLNKDLQDKEVEIYVNGLKGAFDICISGLSDKLRLVSGEDMRFWYNGKNYVKGGGSLNGSCMQNENKGREMQMFVDNPHVCQMLILLDENKKLLGRANVWRLVEPYGSTYMEYIYSRHDKDRELFLMFGKQRGWICADGIGGRGYGVRPSNMVCLLFNARKKYRMGVDALDHFDTFRLQDGRNYQYLSNGCSWNMPKDFVMPVWNDAPKAEPTDKPAVPVFKEGDRVIYKRAGAENDNKIATFVSVREDGKYRIVFDYNKRKFAADPKHLSLAEEKKEGV
jgi:hypothetical protein